MESNENKEKQIDTQKLKDITLSVLPWVGAFLIISILSFFLYPKIKNLPMKIKKEEIKVSLPSPSKDILFLTSPIHQLNGKVESVTAEKLVVSSQFNFVSESPETMMLIPPPTEQQMLENQTPIPTPISKTIKFEVEIDKNTTITRDGFYIPLLFPKEGYNPNKLSYSEIKKDDIVNVLVKEDLRTIKENKVKAIRINLPPIRNQIEGKVINIQGKKIGIEASQEYLSMLLMTAPDQQTEQKKTFYFLVDENTEISYVNIQEPTTEINRTPSPPVKLDLNSIREGEKVRIYTAKDIFSSDSEIKAERIEPLERK